MRVIGFIVVVIIVMMGIYNGGDLKSFIDWGAMLVILAALIGALLMSGSTKVGIAIGGAFGGSSESLQTSRRVLRAARRAVLAAAFVLVGAGTIAVLANVDDTAAIGPGLALALLGLFWGISVAYFVLLPLEAGVERRLMASGETVKARGEDGPDLLMVGVVFAVVMSSMTLLMATLGK